MSKLLLLALVVGAGVWLATRCCSSPPLEPLDANEWWGPNELKTKADDSIKPFKIKFGEERLVDLKARLKNHRPFTPPLEGINFEYGFNSKTLDSWVNYWAEKYPFSEREKFLNQFPQFKTNIQGLDIHFIRVKPEVPKGVDVVPILLMHGWPGSVREFYEAIPLLTTQRPGHNFVFEVIVPSLPGYGFSDGAVRPGLGAAQIGVVLRNLMQRLGFKKFYIQGGDWGALVAASMATYFPDEILGHHSNALAVLSGCNTLKMILGSWFPSLVVDSSVADRLYPLSRFFSFMLEESGYLHIQATKPDTVGVALTDSPSGLLAYIVEKFSTWTNWEQRSKLDGAIESRFTKEQLIDNLMFYWTPKSITTAMRLYSEQFNKKARELKWELVKTDVPTWALQAKYELLYQPASWLRTKYTNLIDTTVVDDGGHFFAFEMPKVFAEDVFKAVKAFREWHKTNRKTEL